MSDFVDVRRAVTSVQSLGGGVGKIARFRAEFQLLRLISIDRGGGKEPDKAMSDGLVCGVGDRIWVLLKACNSELCDASSSSSSGSLVTKSGYALR